MGYIEAIILGLIQGLAEFLPISSSGHLQIGSYLLGSNVEENLLFTLTVHGATVLSTIVVFREDIKNLILGLFTKEYNDEKHYILLLIISMIPVAVVGLFFKDEVEAMFDGNIAFVGSMLLVTAALLAFTYFKKGGNKKIGYIQALVMGVAQSIAVLPGISRSGATITSGLILGGGKREVARFSFLMVLAPIIGANLLEIIGGEFAETTISTGVLIAGFTAAFVSGLLACTWMINLVNRGKLIYFAIYCALIGIIAIFAL